MKGYIWKRLVMAAAVLVGVSILAFMLITVSGTDPAFLTALRGGAAGDSELVEKLRTEMGLDKPLYIRYFVWLKGLFTGKMGISVTTYNPIAEDLAAYFPVTFTLTGLAMIWLIVLSFPTALLCARFHNRLFDHVVRAVTVTGICLPVFWLGFMMLLLLAVKIPIFSVVPSAGVLGYVLPSFSLAFPSACSLIRVIRSSLLAEMSSDYALYARTRGLSEIRIIFCHALKNSLPPAVTMICQYMGYMLAGSAVAESVFSIKGIGSYLVSCVTSGDCASSASCIVIIASVFVVANIAADIINRLLCPWTVREIND